MVLSEFTMAASPSVTPGILWQVSHYQSSAIKDLSKALGGSFGTPTPQHCSFYSKSTMLSTVAQPSASYCQIHMPPYLVCLLGGPPIRKLSRAAFPIAHWKHQIERLVRKEVSKTVISATRRQIWRLSLEGRPWAPLCAQLKVLVISFRATSFYEN